MAIKSKLKIQNIIQSQFKKMAKVMNLPRLEKIFMRITENIAELKWNERGILKRMLQGVISQ